MILIKHGELICANLGDSRAIASLSGLVKTLSTDHNTSNSQERERVFSMGGTIKENRYVLGKVHKLPNCKIGPIFGIIYKVITLVFYTLQTFFCLLSTKAEQSNY